jgi:UDP-N-acetylglucosamine 2-epimerase (non-hydrolysing)
MAAVERWNTHAGTAPGGGARLRQVLVHTGQHYDARMSQVFFDDLRLPKPDYYLGVGSGSHAEQTARIMLAFEPVVLREKPDMVLVVGDVNSTMAASLVAAKLLVPIAHIEAGLRSGDRTMPEELNRLVTDQLADLLFTTSDDADVNLRGEGIAPERIHMVGNTMIDSLTAHLSRALQSPILSTLGVAPSDYAVATLHRPSNVDDEDNLGIIQGALERIAGRLPVIFPVHARTRDNLQRVSISQSGDHSRVRLIEPLGYLDFLCLLAQARLVLTDSGGVQEETTVLGVPCLTLRPNTERPVTIWEGTNRLVNPRYGEEIVTTAMTVLAVVAEWLQASIP